MFCCKSVSLICLLALNQRSCCSIFRVYHAVKNNPVLSINVSVFIFIDNANLSREAAYTDFAEIENNLVNGNDLGTIMGNFFSP